MRSGFKRRFLLLASFLVFCFGLSNLFVNKASAEINNSSTNSDASVNLTTNAASPTKAPVSIKNYSNVVTESADTYNYSTSNNNVVSTNNTITQNNTVNNAVIDTNTNINTNNNTYQNVANTYNTTSDTNVNSNATNNNFNITQQVFLGDSRTVAMESVIGKAKHVWSCKVAMGLDWLKSTGVPAVESKITSGTAVIILMGVNDLHNVNKYIEYINMKEKEWSAKGAKTYFVSVNPINEATYSGFKNTKIEEFNNKMQTGLQNVTYIDTYNYLITHDTSYTADGLHYNKSTSQKIYDLIQEQLQ